MALPGPFAADVSQHSLLDFAQFDLKLAVSGIVDRVRPGFFSILVGIMQPRAQLTGKKKCPRHPDGADGVQLVGIKQHSGLVGGRWAGIAKAV